MVTLRNLAHAAIALVGLSFIFIQASAQDAPKPPNPNDARLNFSFPIQNGTKPFHFKVDIDKNGTILGLDIYKPGSSSIFQRINTCADENSNQQLSGYVDDYTFEHTLMHADLNFDGFEDIGLLEDYSEHLDKWLYCIYLWNNKTERFVYSKELTDIASSIEVDPKAQTIRTYDNWMGGAFDNSTYRWNHGKLELIEEDSLLGAWSQQTAKTCGYTYHCDQLINGKMVTTLTKPICTGDEMDDLPSCPAVPSNKPK